MTSVRVRRLDDNWDPVYGNGRNDYLTDQDAMLQIVKSRLQNLYGEWWENTLDGLPLFQKILGRVRVDKSIPDKLIQKRIKETLYVKKITKFTSQFDPNTRQYSCQAVIDTEFGVITVASGGV